MCRCLSRHWSLTFCTLNSFKLCTLWLSSIPVLLLLSWVCLYWYSCVKRRRYSGSTTYKIQPRRHEGVRQTWRTLQLIAILCETRMHRTSMRACPWHRPCICQIELVKRSCWSFRPPEIASLPPFLSFPKTVFPRCSLVAEPLTYPSPADIPELYSRVLQTNFGRSHPNNSNWEGKIHTCEHVKV